SARNLPAFQGQLREIARSVEGDARAAAPTKQARGWICSDGEERDRNELLRYYPGPGRIHFRHHADQARKTVPRRPHPSEVACGLCGKLSRLCVAVCLEPRRRDP